MVVDRIMVVDNLELVRRVQVARHQMARHQVAEQQAHQRLPQVPLFLLPRQPVWGPLILLLGLHPVATMLQHKTTQQT